MTWNTLLSVADKNGGKPSEWGESLLQRACREELWDSCRCRVSLNAFRGAFLGYVIVDLLICLFSEVVPAWLLQI